MQNAQGIETRVLAIVSAALERSDIGPDDPLDLSSIQILKALAQIERTFEIEVEDDDVFHGLFTSVRHISDYVCQKLDIS